MFTGYSWDFVWNPLRIGSGEPWQPWQCLGDYWLCIRHGLEEGCLGMGRWTWEPGNLGWAGGFFLCPYFLDRDDFHVKFMKSDWW